jgi:N-acetylglucosaminyldiphosphoundecaprenol N-acetyl-beta-D-mannosaminyltransferase
MPKFEQILGIRFFNGTAWEAVAHVNHIRGYAVAPAAPALANIQRDAGYCRALSKADVAIADSGFMVLLWRLLQRRTITRISGLKYLRILLADPRLRERGSIFLVLPHQSSLEKALAWLRHEGFEIANDDCYIAPVYFSCSHGSVSREERERVSQRRGYSIADDALIAILEQRKPKHIIVGIGGGTQEKLGLYLREHLSYRPAIHCIGAALAFLTGDQKPIPMWADRIYLGWFLRLARAPHRYARRFSPAFRLPGMIWRYGSEMPPLKITK